MTRARRFVVDHYLALPIGALVALAWANTLPVSYFALANRLAFAVNDVGMTLFFALMTREVIEASVPDGTLYTWRRLALAVVAAAGGIAGAAAAYVGYLHAGDEGSLLVAGWPVVCATDVAFSYCVARTVCHPRALPFLLLVGLAGNAIALVVLELRYPIHEVHSAGAPLVMAAIIAALVMRRCDVRGFWPYLLGAGALSWWGLFLSGLHPALALVPIVPFLSRSSRTRHAMTDAPLGARDALSRLYQTLKSPVHVILFLFGVANAGVILRGAGTGTWAIAVAALVGKPMGILIALVIAVRCGLRLPRFVSWREMIVLTIASSTGFTFALFFATVVYPIGPVLGEIKLGALMTSVAAAVTVLAAWALRVGRFAHVRAPRHRVAAEYLGV
jgi:Na+:H+ antiporter, NhaA family